MTNQERKILKRFYKKGLISYNLFMYDDIDKKIKDLMCSGMKKTHAVVKLSNDMGLSKRTIWNALKAMD